MSDAVKTKVVEATVRQGQFEMGPLLLGIRVDGVTVWQLNHFLEDLCGEELHLVNGELWPGCHFFLKKYGVRDVQRIMLTARECKDDPEVAHLVFSDVDGTEICQYPLEWTTISEVAPPVDV